MPIPVHVIRYEDLLAHPSEVMTQVFQFILGAESLEGTLIEKLIEERTRPS